MRKKKLKRIFCICFVLISTQYLLNFVIVAKAFSGYDGSELLDLIILVDDSSSLSMKSYTSFTQNLYNTLLNYSENESTLSKYRVCIIRFGKNALITLPLIEFNQINDYDEHLKTIKIQRGDSDFNNAFKLALKVLRGVSSINRKRHILFISDGNFMPALQSKNEYERILDNLMKKLNELAITHSLICRKNSSLEPKIIGNKRDKGIHVFLHPDQIKIYFKLVMGIICNLYSISVEFVSEHLNNNPLEIKVGLQCNDKSIDDKHILFNNTIYKDSTIISTSRKPTSMQNRYYTIKENLSLGSYYLNVDAKYNTLVLATKEVSFDIGNTSNINSSDNIDLHIFFQKNFKWIFLILTILILLLILCIFAIKLLQNNKTNEICDDSSSNNDKNSMYDQNNNDDEYINNHLEKIEENKLQNNKEFFRKIIKESQSDFNQLSDILFDKVPGRYWTKDKETIAHCITFLLNNNYCPYKLTCKLFNAEFNESDSISKFNVNFFHDLFEIVLTDNYKISKNNRRYIDRLMKLIKSVDSRSLDIRERLQKYRLSLDQINTKNINSCFEDLIKFLNIILNKTKMLTGVHKGSVGLSTIEQFLVLAVESIKYEFSKNSFNTHPFNRLISLLLERLGTMHNYKKSNIIIFLAISTDYKQLLSHIKGSINNVKLQYNFVFIDYNMLYTAKKSESNMKFLIDKIKYTNLFCLVITKAPGQILLQECEEALSALQDTHSPLKNIMIFEPKDTDQWEIDEKNKWDNFKKSHFELFTSYCDNNHLIIQITEEINKFCDTFFLNEYDEE